MKSKLAVLLFFLLALGVFVLPYMLIETPATSATNRYKGWWLPETSSTYAPQIDTLFNVILWITIVVFVLVTIALLWFLWKYRAQGKKATYTHGNNKLEIAWTAIPAVILVFLAIFSNDLWSEMRYPSQYPENAAVIRIKPRQFQWDITYSGADKKFDTPDDINTINQLWLVKDEPVQILLQAQDVIHSFFVPEFRIKQDAVPGMTTSVWITPTELTTDKWIPYVVRDTETVQSIALASNKTAASMTPEQLALKNGITPTTKLRAGQRILVLAPPYEIACAELCGGQHSFMKGFVTVTNRDSVDSYLRSQMDQ